MAGEPASESGDLDLVRWDTDWKELHEAQTASLCSLHVFIVINLLYKGPHVMSESHSSRTAAVSLHV